MIHPGKLYQKNSPAGLPFTGKEYLIWEEINNIAD